jgi:type I restriction enzyme S subunit
MKKGWKTMPRGELCDVLDHKRKPITKRDREAGEYPYYGATGVLDHVAGYLFDEPLVLVGEDGAKWASGENTAFAVEGKIWVNNHAHVLRPHRTVLLDNWLIYHLNHSDLIEFVSGLTVPKLNQGCLREIPVPVPPLTEQQRIVGLLDEAFEGLATAKANAEKNLQNAHALFESHLQSVFTQRGPGWVEKHKPLSELCELIVDCEHKTAPIQEEGYPSIRTPNIGKGKLLLEGVNRVSEETYKAWTRRAEPLAGDLILAREAPAGNVAVIPEDTRVCLGQRTVLIRPKADIFNPSFLALRLLEPQMQEKLLAHSRGATVQHVNMKDIRALDVGAIPRLRVQEQIAANVNAVSAEGERLARLYERKHAALDALKKSLLHQAFTGAL